MREEVNWRKFKSLECERPGREAEELGWERRRMRGEGLQAVSQGCFQVQESPETMFNIQFQARQDYLEAENSWFGNVKEANCWREHEEWKEERAGSEEGDK